MKRSSAASFNFPCPSLPAGHPVAAHVVFLIRMTNYKTLNTIMKSLVLSSVAMKIMQLFLIAPR